jgi:hypothetical protein
MFIPKMLFYIPSTTTDDILLAFVCTVLAWPDLSALRIKEYLLHVVGAGHMLENPGCTLLSS